MANAPTGSGPNRTRPRERRDGQRRCGRYFTFVLDCQEYGIEIQKVREIIRLMPITPIPFSPPHIKGVINLRGKIVPVIDLRLKIGLVAAPASDRTCIVVVDVGVNEVGMIVDEVSEVLAIAENDISDPPEFAADVDTDFILGIGRAGDHMTILLDIARVLTNTDASSVFAPCEDQRASSDEPVTSSAF